MVNYAHNRFGRFSLSRNNSQVLRRGISVTSRIK
uniref:Uncharacterized protein n=1 Tax=Arundo donax TaxID=35708 RepID=A0A0A9AST9_ARUDO